jgi:hypothetical protein
LLALESARLLFSLNLVNRQAKLAFTHKPLQGTLILTLTREQKLEQGTKPYPLPVSETVLKPVLEHEFRLTPAPYLKQQPSF